MVYAITRLSVPGESVREILALFLISVVLGVSFLYMERWASQPLVPLNIFHRRMAITADMVMFLAFGANAAIVFVITLFLQEGRGYSPLAMWLIFVPGGLGGITGATFAPRIIKKICFVRMRASRLVLFGIGIAGLVTIGIVSSIILLMDFYYVAALGIVSAIVSLNIAGTNGMEPGRQGLAAGLLTTSQQIGTAIGVGMVSAVLAATSPYLGRSPAAKIKDLRYTLLL